MIASDARLAVIGLGYVGLPLAAQFANKREVVGFDIDPARVTALRAGFDATGEVTKEELAAAHGLTVTSDPADLVGCDVFIVTVPTPVDDAKRPDLTALEHASETVGVAIAQRSRPGLPFVVFESTVFPGCTRNVCVPILEAQIGRKLDEGFAAGYSPERINPGDRAHRIADIIKVTSGSTPAAAAAIDALYGEIVTAGTHCVSSIEVAEAAKVIENTQRDLNIALMNELAVLFHALDLDTVEVLEAAGTKWNFLNFRPGLVGGHCIGVDPYYLTYRAQQIGFHPEMILAGRRINDRMASVVVDRTMRLMLTGGAPVVGSRILVMGLTFKEDCPDLRNSQAVDIVKQFQTLNAIVEVWDPMVAPGEAAREHGIETLTHPPVEGRYDAVIVAVGHSRFKALGAAAVRRFTRDQGVLFDVKSLFPREQSDGRL